MYYIENIFSEDMSIIIKNIEKYLLINDYENAFIIFLLHIKRINFLDRDELIRYFHKYFTTKCDVIR